MRSKKIVECLLQVKKLTKKQIYALKNNDIQRLFELQDKRRSLFKTLERFKQDLNIQNIDAEIKLSVKSLIQEIQQLDSELRSLIKDNMNRIMQGLISIENIKHGFLKTKKSALKTKNFNVNI